MSTCFTTVDMVSSYANCGCRRYFLKTMLNLVVNCFSLAQLVQRTDMAKSIIGAIGYQFHVPARDIKQTRCSSFASSIQNNTLLFRLHLFLILFASHWLPIVDLRPSASHTQKVVNYVPSLM